MKRKKRSKTSQQQHLDARMLQMTDQQIIDLFDSSNITLRELAAISGRSVAELKALLMGGK